VNTVASSALDWTLIAPERTPLDGLGAAVTEVDPVVEEE